MFRINTLARAIAAASSLALGLSTAASAHSANHNDTATPIKHVVVIFQENVSFDHYFGTYPKAMNPQGEPRFEAAANTPAVNGLNDELLYRNPNAANPMRLDRTEALTCDQDHGYLHEQKAYNHGMMDKFVEYTNREGCSSPDASRSGLVMDYYDGNTVTALWNYAQHYAMSDNSFSTTFGPSTPGALNLVSGQTHGATPDTIANSVANGSVIGDPNPTYDDCSSGTTIAMSGTNIGDLLNAKGITWGWFQGGFRPTSTSNGKAVCGATTANIGGASIPDYSPHHEPFQYYASTANPHHLAPSSVAKIGQTDQANHQYDLTDFWAAVANGNMPAVTFLKAKMSQDGHAGYSDPLDEQKFIVDTINRLQMSPEWASTAVIIAYDDSDGWYDHVMGPIVTQSNDPSYDALGGDSLCGGSNGSYSDRCGYGPRQPLLVVSPWSKANFVDHSITDQSSILRFIEDNWNTGRIGDDSADAKAGSIENMFDFARPRDEARRLFLDPNTGVVINHGHFEREEHHHRG